jgi:hypothetical protein
MNKHTLGCVKLKKSTKSTDMLTKREVVGKKRIKEKKERKKDWWGNES